MIPGTSLEPANIAFMCGNLAPSSDSSINRFKRMPSFLWVTQSILVRTGGVGEGIVLAACCFSSASIPANSRVLSCGPRWASARVWAFCIDLDVASLPLVGAAASTVGVSAEAVAGAVSGCAVGATTGVAASGGVGATGAVPGVVVAGGGAGITGVSTGGAGCAFGSAIGDGAVVDAPAVGAPVSTFEGDVPSRCVSATSVGGI